MTSAKQKAQISQSAPESVVWLALLKAVGEAGSDSAVVPNNLPAQSVLEFSPGNRLVTEIDSEADHDLRGARVTYHIANASADSNVSLALESVDNMRFGALSRWFVTRQYVSALKDVLARCISHLPRESDVANPLNIPGLENDLALFVHDERTDLFVSDEIRRFGIWEEYETAVLCRLLKPGQTFIDVGANIGYYTALTSRLVGDSGKVFAFEPDPHNYNLLAANALHNGLSNATAVQAALSNVTRPGKLFISPDNCGDHQVYDADDGRESIAVPMLNGSQYLQSHVSRAHFIKIDTQGAEVGVISGLLPLIKASLPNLIMITEFWPFGLRRCGHTGEELLALLLEAGFTRFAVVEHGQRLLIETDVEELERWIRQTSSNPDSVGFINLLCTSAEKDLGEVDNHGFFPRRKPD